jgi:uncharacterized membrane protein YkoI
LEPGPSPDTGAHGRTEDQLRLSGFRFVLLCLLAAGIAATADVEADRGGKGKGGGGGALISQDRAAAAARSATGGRVLNIRLQDGKRPQYRVKVLLDGNRVRNVGVDARSGAVLK